jgi:hypothetical protein
MKKQVFKAMMIVGLSLGSTGLFADPPAMPGNHGQGGDQIPGGGAPVGTGIGLMIALSAAYGAFRMKLENQQDEAKA